jgi:hypothetical protein
MSLMPAVQCLTTEPGLISGRAGEKEKDDNPTKQRRYFVKTGRYVDNEEEILASRSAGAEKVILDKPPADLKSIFPKLSLR